MLPPPETEPADMPLNPETRYVHLSNDGAIQDLLGGAAFWSLPAEEMRRFDAGWLITEFVCEDDWANWEMHPEADEFVYLLSGDVALVLELPTGTATIRLSDRGAVVVPRGVWHTARVFATSRMLFVTRGAGTEHRPSAAG
ncbi:MAG TPA: cupin domain-containing protein [Aquimonas sp.]|nr:cupin domain-containing protein [Aquimonas sp.]HRF53434.1 cupin domain-containing protein [Aquimonas sp.]